MHSRGCKFNRCRLKVFLREVVVSVTCFFLGFNLSAQELINVNKNILYIEGSTKGPRYSINYERIFNFRKKLAWSFRVGGFVGKTAIGFPLGINAILGKQQHHAEISFVSTPYIKQYRFLWDDKNTADKCLYLSPTVGYRYQKPGDKLYFKISAGPLLYLDPPSDDFWKMETKFFGYGSVSLGVSF